MCLPKMENLQNMVIIQVLIVQQQECISLHLGDFEYYSLLHNTSLYYKYQ
ncbi:hypothetical protein TTHERM_002653372 (macronuclear) [Tetrahymena thermophila SB210]|uniref:Uncharacterized protein n=1 Tax=Tetrahymena thermophila (strain SB210) TaxID=312017 RepID=W7X186_TETTS|nr:hypothetical protein TTHERM_002653372 [Tetrahymena thermophila SB210]EWS72985.1 hypothetical protein TTHERM_002653372 [Tetrahymena thermophila SB210]|eukprot:XP_012654480.1 hypothetical protein TTHERM_002653372 [Tetrahymena thermophila SB210]